MLLEKKKKSIVFRIAYFVKSSLLSLLPFEDPLYFVFLQGRIYSKDYN